MIIGVSGKQGVGKSTFSDVAVEEFGYTSMSFASILKIDLIEFLKEAGVQFKPEKFYCRNGGKLENVAISCEFVAEYPCLSKFGVHSPIMHMQLVPYRGLMQWFGDLRRGENKDYWLQRFMETCDFSEDIVIDDVRFTSEAALIHALGGLLVRIEWPTRQNKSTHISETNLDTFPLFDCTIVKDHGLSLADYKDTCREHLKLLTGELDEPQGQSDPCETEDSRESSKVIPDRE